jgi:hypothetical protein
VKLAGIVLSTVVAVLLAALGEIVSEEIRARLDRIPIALLKAASRRLSPDLRTEFYEQAWLPELHEALRGDEAMPITRLILGIRFAARLLLAAPALNREFSSAPARPKLSQRLLHAWHGFLDQRSTYGDHLVGWCMLSTLAYLFLLIHSHIGKLIGFESWIALNFLRAWTKSRLMKRHGLDPKKEKFHASSAEVAIILYVIAPAICLWGLFTMGLDIFTLAIGHGSIGTWFGLIFSLLYIPFPWVTLHMAKTHAARMTASPESAPITQ